MNIVLITVLCTIIGLLTAVLGWLVIRTQKQGDERLARLDSVLSTMEASHKNMSDLLARYGEILNTQIALCKLRHDTMDKVVSSLADETGQNREGVRENREKLITLGLRFSKLNIQKK